MNNHSSYDTLPLNKAVQMARRELNALGPGAVVRQAQKLLEKSPDHAGVNALYAQCLIDSNDLAQAAPFIEKAVNAAPNDINVLITQSKFYRSHNKYDAALKSLQKAIKSAPKEARLYASAGELLRERGFNDEALKYYNRAIKLEPLNPAAYYAKMMLPDTTLTNREITAIHTIVNSRSMEPHWKAGLYFSLARHYQRGGDIAQEMENYDAGNAIKYQQLRDFPHISRQATPELIKAAFTQARIEQLTLPAENSEQLIFIVGFPRSGSTLLEQMLCQLPGVSTAGESPALHVAETDAVGPFLTLSPYPAWFAETDTRTLQALRDSYLQLQQRYNTADCLIDKSLDNIYKVGLIKTLWPNAKILHTYKNPVDCCLGCYRQIFDQNAWPCIYDQKELGIAYRHYHEIMCYWDSLFPGEIKHVAYEALVSDPETSSRAIADYCGLTWQPDMIDLKNSSAGVRTMSASQVKEGLHTREIGRWKKYRDYLGDLVELDKLSPF